MEPVLNGGFPITFLFDAPGIPVVHQLSFGEDEFRLDDFVMNAVLYSVLFAPVGRAATSRRTKNR